MTHPGGRPTKYRPHFCQLLDKAAAEGYSLTAFAGSLGSHRDQLIEWAAKFPEFADAVKRAKALRTQRWETQAINISQNGGSGGQAVMTIFGLKNVAPEEWRDRVEHEHSGTVTMEMLVRRALEAPGESAKVIEHDASLGAPSDDAKSQRDSG